MSETLFIFTFGPVQSFIAEARRGQDLFAGSRILSKLAKAALVALTDAGAKAIYPLLDAHHVPNKLVLKLGGQNPQAMGDTATQALVREWNKLVNEAHKKMTSMAAGADSDFETIWDRQVNNVWECYWATVALVGRPYGDAYHEANQLLDATKRARPFEQVHEDGMKDTLSGRRSALHTKSLEAREYWTSVGNESGITAAQLRPEGKERLDAIGCVKRFGLPLDNIPSVTTVASQDFLAEARKNHTEALRQYSVGIRTLLGSKAYRVRSDTDWPNDGDLFYAETLTSSRMADSYGSNNFTDGQLKPAREALRDLVKAVGWKPSTYYAVLALDGDDVGKRIDSCATSDDHTRFSQTVSAFAQQAGPIVDKHQGFAVYIGGDDVLALLPLSTAIDAGKELADAFHHQTGNNASVGIAIAHMLYPLGLVLEEARHAERDAKSITGKAAIAIHALKRSGETVCAVAKWDQLVPLNEVICAIRDDHLSSKFAYDLRNCASAFTNATGVGLFASSDTANSAFNAEIKRLARRHTQAKDWNPDDLIGKLQRWATAQNDATVFGDWMVLARFIAQRGEE